MAGFEQTIDQIKERIDIVSLVGSMVELKKSGRSLKGLCPFHSEKTPSFHVFPDQGSFHCFGCSASGDIFTFVMRTQNLDFGEALRRLAQQAGVALPEARQETDEDRLLERLRAASEAAALYFQAQLLNSPTGPAAAYLAKRNVDRNSLERFQLGYAPHSWDQLLNHLLERGFTVEECEGAGLITPREGGGFYDRFRNRVMFPIRDSRDRVVGFGARALDDSIPKYLNSPQTRLFDKGGNLFGISRAAQAIRDQDSAVIVEGYFDVILLHQHGIRNVVAALGTALSERQIGMIKRLTRNLVLALDADAAGEAATMRGLEMAVHAFGRKMTPVPGARGRVKYEARLNADIRILPLPAGKDPDEVVSEAPEAWEGLLARALPVVDFYFEQLTGGLDLTTARDKSTAVDRLLPVIKDLATDQVERWHYVQKLAQLVRTDERMLMQQLTRLNTAMPAASLPEPLVKQTGAMGPEEYFLALALSNLENLTTEVLAKPEEVENETSRQILAAIWSGLEQGPLTQQMLLQSLPEDLAVYCDELNERLANQPPIEDGDLAFAYEMVSLRLKEEYCRRNLRQNEYLIQAAREESDGEQLRLLTDKSIELNLYLDSIFKAKHERQHRRRR